MIPNQRNHGRWTLASKLKNAVDTSLRIWAAVDVVAQEHDSVVGLQLDLETSQEILKRFSISVNVTDRDSRHFVPLPGPSHGRDDGPSHHAGRAVGSIRMSARPYPMPLAKSFNNVSEASI